MQEAWEDTVWRGQGTGMQGLITDWPSEEIDVRIQVFQGSWSGQDPYLILWALTWLRGVETMP